MREIPPWIEDDIAKVRHQAEVYQVEQASEARRNVLGHMGDICCGICGHATCSCRESGRGMYTSKAGAASLTVKMVDGEWNAVEAGELVSLIDEGAIPRVTITITSTGADLDACRQALRSTV